MTVTKRSQNIVVGRRLCHRRRLWLMRAIVFSGLIVPIDTFTAPGARPMHHRSVATKVGEKYTTVIKVGRAHDDDPEHSKSLLEKAVDKVKALLPWQDEETRQGAMERQRQRKEIAHALDEPLRGFPLPFRMIGKAITSGVGRVMNKEGKKVEILLKDAQHKISADGAAVSLLGKPIVVGQVFSQSSSTTTINGRKTRRVQVSFEVRGSRRTGVGHLVADGYRKGCIYDLGIDIGGRAYNVEC